MVDVIYRKIEEVFEKSCLLFLLEDVLPIVAELPGDFKELSMSEYRILEQISFKVEFK